MQRIQSANPRTNVAANNYVRIMINEDVEEQQFGIQTLTRTQSSFNNYDSKKVAKKLSHTPAIQISSLKTRTRNNMTDPKFNTGASSSKVDLTRRYSPTEAYGGRPLSS